MTQANTRTGMIRIASIAALFAWFMLLGQTFAHAEHMDHADLPSNHCLMCSAGGLEDDIVPTGSMIESVAPFENTNPGSPDSLVIPGSEKQTTPAARAPPRR